MCKPPRAALYRPVQAEIFPGDFFRARLAGGALKPLRQQRLHPSVRKIPPGCIFLVEPSVQAKKRTVPTSPARTIGENAPCFHFVKHLFSLQMTTFCVFIDFESQRAENGSTKPFLGFTFS